MTRNRCDVCGRFRKTKHLVGMGGENNEQWTECVDCMSESDLKFYKMQRTEEDSNESS